MSRNTMTKSGLGLGLAVAMLALGACSGEADTGAETAATGEPGTQTIAALIAQTDQLSALEELMDDGGLGPTFDSTAAYTVLAPTDAAMATLGEDFTGNAARPALLALLRRHIVPGYLTRDDIADAIAANGGPVEMQTMGEGTLTFAMDGEELTVVTKGGSTPVQVTEEMLGANGVVIPVDSVLGNIQS